MNEKMNGIKIHRRLSYILICALAVCLVLSVSGGHAYAEESSQAVSAEVETCYPAVSDEEVVQRASLVITGVVSKESNPFSIRSVGGGDPVKYSDFTVKITDVIRGTAPEDSVAVRVSDSARKDYAAQQVGDKVLLFLYQPKMGGGCNTKGDYYYIAGNYSGIYYQDESEGKRILRDSHGNALEWKEFMQKIKELSEQYPVNENYNRDEFLENQKHNLESGFISQQEYDSYLAEENMYAEIVPWKIQYEAPGFSKYAEKYKKMYRMFMIGVFMTAGM
ncbi:MAG: hypothetical protein HFE90_03900 [Firmicutes bacterium]|nr:hypothetical protein [Bacillota bacterium]